MSDAKRVKVLTTLLNIYKEKIDSLKTENDSLLADKKELAQTVLELRMKILTKYKENNPTHSSKQHVMLEKLEEAIKTD